MCDFDVVDAVQKLEKLGVVMRVSFISDIISQFIFFSLTIIFLAILTQDSIGRIYCVGLKRANEIIGPTTEELVLKAKQGVIT